MKLKFQALEKKIGDTLIFQVRELEAQGELFTLLGSSGAGKSTLIRMLAGLDSQYTGEICLDDQAIPTRSKEVIEYRKKNAIVFQNHNLLSHLNVLSNIIFPLVHVHQVKKSEAIEKAMELLTRFQLQEHAHKQIFEISKGQSQRIALCRALVFSPHYLFLDEPTASLDPEMTYEVLKMIRELKDEQTNIILVTHNIEFAFKINPSILFFSDRTIRSFSVNEFKTSEDLSVSHFLKNVIF